MNIQEAAYKLLKEEGHPLKPEEIARRALQQGLVTSRSKDPVQAHHTTLRKNIRNGVYNHPKLVTVYVPGQRGMFVALPEWQTKAPGAKAPAPIVLHVERKIQMPTQLVKQVELINQAGITKTFDDSVVFLLRKGWEVVRPVVHEELKKLIGDNGNSD